MINYTQVLNYFILHDKKMKKENNIMIGLFKRLQFSLTSWLPVEVELLDVVEVTGSNVTETITDGNRS